MTERTAIYTDPDGFVWEYKREHGLELLRQWQGEDYADPDTEPIPSLDEAVKLMGLLLTGVTNPRLPFCGCCGRGEGHNDSCTAVLAQAWLAAQTNDESSDLPW